MGVSARTGKRLAGGQAAAQQGSSAATEEDKSQASGESAKVTNSQRGETRPKGRNNYKRRGDLAEMEFTLKASSKGFSVAKPYGENERYDFIIDADRKLWRIQVKSSSCTHWRGYTVHSCWKSTKIRMPYLPSEIDFFAVLIIGRGIWYLIPVRALGGRLMVRLYPFGGDSKGSRSYEKYREAWHLLRKHQR